MAGTAVTTQPQQQQQQQPDFEDKVGQAHHAGTLMDGARNG